MSQLKLNLYENAIDSITHAIEHYTSDPNEKRRYKYAILHLSQGVTLLIKERLSREHENFIFKEVHKPEGNTVNVEMSISRLEKIANVDLGDAKGTILELTRLRNDIEHRSVDLPKQKADSIIGRIVPFLVSFIKNELGDDLQAKIDKETWQELLNIKGYRDHAIKEAKRIIAKSNDMPRYCPNCQENTAIIRYNQEDEWSFHHYTVSCISCSDTVSSGLVCFGCSTEVELGNGKLTHFNSYCSDCYSQAANEFKGIEFPTYGFEIRRWFQKNDTITYLQLLKFVGNISTLVSGSPRLPDQLFRIGAIEFANDYNKERNKARKSAPYEELAKLGLHSHSSERFASDDKFIWIWDENKSTEDD